MSYSDEYSDYSEPSGDEYSDEPSDDHNQSSSSSEDEADNGVTNTQPDSDTSESDTSSADEQSMDEQSMCSLVSTQLELATNGNNEKHPLAMTIPQIQQHVNKYANNTECKMVGKYTCRLCEDKAPFDEKSFYTHILSHKVSDFMKK